MKPILAIKHFAGNSRRSEPGSTRIVILALVSFLAGVGITVFWFHHAAATNGGTASQIASETPAPAPESVGVPAPPAATPQPPPAPVQPTDPAVIEQVKKEVPDYATASLDAATQTLRAAALKAFADATAEADSEIKAAQQQLQDAQNTGSAADQQAAMKRVQDAQSAAAEKLKQIAADLQNQIAALKILKKSP
jgi:type IV secretory pathway VirB10-like protein